MRCEWASMRGKFSAENWDVGLGIGVEVTVGSDVGSGTDVVQVADTNMPKASPRAKKAGRWAPVLTPAIISVETGSSGIRVPT